MLRTHTCGELRAAHVGTPVALCGWVQSVREHGALRFYDLRDQYGVVQLRASGDLGHLQAVPKESVVRVTGTVMERPEGTANPALATGEIEIDVDTLEVLSECRPLPFEITEWSEAREELRLLHRYLDLRRPTLRRNISTRHRLERTARAALEDQGFMSVETPMLVRSTPEGSRDFVVPSRLHPGRFFALPQSPQLYKQILMIAGIDRYYQFARCFRDEDPRRGRQFVHTQIDIEMAFCTQEDVFEAVEGMLVRALAEVFDKDVARPFPRVTYDEAAARWGIDKPDTRFGLELADVTDLVRACGYRIFREAAERGGAVKCLALPGCAAYSRAEIAKLEEIVKIYQASGLAWARRAEGGPAASFERHVRSEEIDAVLDRAGAGREDLVVLCAGPTAVVNRALGQLRSAMGGRLDLAAAERLEFLWITDFPMFEWDDEAGRWAPMHHMFTMPREDHLHLLESDPGAVRAQLYDLVCNGVELGSGSVRIHRPELQRRIMQFVGLDAEQVEQQFGFLLRAYEYGAPPHAGIGIGFDNLVMTLLGLENIRDVIAFPNATGGVYPLDDSPAPITAEQLRELRLQLRTGK